MTKSNTLDTALERWDALYSAHEASKPKIDRAVPLTPHSRRRVGSTGPGAASARTELTGIAKKSPQVIVKITGGGKGSRMVSAHLKYISRNGELPLEDQDARLHGGTTGRHDIVERWEYAGMPWEARHREAFNIVLSSPRDSDPVAVQRAARDFAKEQFGGRHDFVMALHTPDTDPSPKRSENTHVHLVVKARSYDGVRLNPRKADLFAYRKAYARHLRANGIDVIAVRREAVFNTRSKAAKQSVHHLRKRGALRVEKLTSPEALKKALASEARAREIYGEVITALADSAVAADRDLAKGLRQVLPLNVKPGQATQASRARGCRR